MEGNYGAGPYHRFHNIQTKNKRMKAIMGFVETMQLEYGLNQEFVVDAFKKAFPTKQAQEAFNTELVAEMGEYYKTLEEENNIREAKNKRATTGWYVVDHDAPDYYLSELDSESEGPHGTYADAKRHFTDGRIIRFLDDDGYLYIEEPDTE